MNRVFRYQLWIILLVSWVVIVGVSIAKFSYEPHLLNQSVAAIEGCNIISSGYGNLKVRTIVSNQISELKFTQKKNDICTYIEINHINEFDLHFYKQVVLGFKTPTTVLLSVSEGSQGYKQKSSTLLLVLILLNIFVLSVYAISKIGNKIS